MNILVLNFFPAFYPPTSGGELRLNNILLKLSETYNITLLAPTYDNSTIEEIEHTKNFLEIRIPKEKIHNQIHAKIAEENICSEISGLVCYFSADYFNKYHEFYLKYYEQADIIIHNTPYMVNYDLFLGIDNKIRIYNSDNFEYSLVKQMWHGVKASDYITLIYEAEKKLVQNCDLIFATSNEERQAFIDTYSINLQNVKLAPNGIDVSLYENLRKDRIINKRKKAFFIGSAHPPNREACRYIIEVVAPECPGIDFFIAGKCCDGFKSGNNVFLLGLINDEQKLELFRQSDIAINPMFSGAGTNLKTLEFLSAGIPLVSTDVGVRGLDLDKSYFILTDKDHFSKTLNETIDNKEFLAEMSLKGQSYVNENYSWKSICDNIIKNIQTSILKRKKYKKQQKTILMLNDYEVNKPVAGGAVRIYNLLYNISSNFKIVYLCLNDRAEIKVECIIKDKFHMSVPKTQQHIDTQNKINKNFVASAEDIISGELINENEVYMQIVKLLYSESDAIILEHPFLIGAIDGLYGKPVIYESHNFEYKLKKEMLYGFPEYYDRLINDVKEFEKNTLNISDLVISVSDSEVENLKKFSGRSDLDITVIPNGVEIVEPCYNYEEFKKVLGNRQIITFVGSAHTPNIEAASYIIDCLARQFPDYIFAIIGSVCNAFNRDQISPNILLFGVLPTEYKNFILFSSSIALNPMKQGAGSNLKLAEYFAFRIPTITTRFGARGYQIENNKHAIICELEEFAAMIKKVLGNSKHYQEMVAQAYRYASEKLSWKVLADKYEKCLEKLIQVKKLLVVTYRYNNPPKGGAEVFLNNVISRIAMLGNFKVDIVTTNIGDIYNKFHFSNDYSYDDDRITNIPNLKCLKFPVDDQNIDEQWEECCEIYKTFMQGGRDIALKYVNLYKEPLMLGGWHYPEKRGEIVQVWMSEKASVFVKNYDKLYIKGYSTGEKKIIISIDNINFAEYCIRDNFDLEIDVCKGEIVTIQSEPMCLKNQDPRLLSLIIYNISVGIKGIIKSIDFYNDYKNYLKKYCLSDYIDALIENAERIPDKIENLFYKNRGPKSKEMNDWLEKNIKNYDAVICHSAPFNTIVLGEYYANKYCVPSLLIPHYHIEDEFYHWKQYYHAFQNANKVIIAPAVSRELFYDKLGVQSVILPGGGVDISEFKDINNDEFNKIYNSETPFILVLGRKAGSKNYKWVINAVESINYSESKVNLVIIGRDEDKEQIYAKNTLYLGEQPRNVVLGALNRCEFLVNMSESESFGIVILEAWLAKKTVIVNECCKAFTELVVDGENGILANRNNLLLKLENLLNNNKKFQLAINGWKKVQENYTWDSLAKSIELLLLESVDNKNGVEK